MIRRLFSYCLCMLVISQIAYAIPNGEGGHEFPLGSDAGDDFLVDTDKFVVEGDDGDVGVGIASPLSLFHLEGSLGLNVTTITATTTLNDTHNIVLCNNSSDIDVDLPASSSNTDKVYYIKKIGNNANTVTIDPNGAETIDGATTLILYVRYDAVRIVSDGSNWHVISDELRPHVAKMTRDSSQSITQNTLTKIAFDTEKFDVGGIADSVTNDRFTIRRDGKYFVAASWTTAAAVSNIALEATVCNGGGTTRLEGNQFNPGSSLSTVASASVSTILDLSANDIIEFCVQQTDVGALNTHANDAFEPKMVVKEVRP